MLLTTALNNGLLIPNALMASTNPLPCTDALWYTITLVFLFRARVLQNLKIHLHLHRPFQEKREKV